MHTITDTYTAFTHDYGDIAAVVDIRIRNWMAVLEDHTFCRLFIALLLKIYSKLGQPEDF